MRLYRPWRPKGRKARTKPHWSGWIDLLKVDLHSSWQYQDLVSTETTALQASKERFTWDKGFRLRTFGVLSRCRECTLRFQGFSLGLTCTGRFRFTRAPLCWLQSVSPSLEVHSALSMELPVCALALKGRHHHNTTMASTHTVASGITDCLIP